MKFGSREIANVVFRAKSKQKIGNTIFKPGQPVLYIDTATTSQVEGSATSVYANGGRGNTRLVTWEGDKTLTFTVEDALLSPIGLAILSGAGLWKGVEENKPKVHVHTMTNAYVGDGGVIDLSDAVKEGEEICASAPIFVMIAEEDGSITGDIFDVTAVDAEKNTVTVADGVTATLPAEGDTKAVVVDYYVLRDGSTISEIQIDAEKFAGYFYVEAETLFRRQDNGVDMPANLTFPNVKIQSNFTIGMAATGDPSTFSFVMDAMPDYTYFNKKKKVLCAIQIIDGEEVIENLDTVFGETYSETDGTAHSYDHDWHKTAVLDGETDEVDGEGGAYFELP